MIERVLRWWRAIAPVECPSCEATMHRHEGYHACACGVVADLEDGSWRYGREWDFRHSLSGLAVVYAEDGE